MRTFLPLMFAPSALGATAAATAGSISQVGDTLISAMMMFVGNEDKLYILDKAEGNAAQAAGHPAWGSVMDLHTFQTTTMPVMTNTFCSSGAHLPNGSYATFGGNSAVGPGASAGSQNGQWDATYNDFDGTKSIRVLDPCTAADSMTDTKCQWFDDPALLSMQAQRWYSAAEALANGTVAIVGGFSGGGYVCRNYPNTDPTAGCTLSYEFFPSNGRPPTDLPFLHKTSGLNAYPHTFLMKSGLMFMQANLSTMLWDYNANTETDLPDMPNNVVRVYPASGATAMLPMTPANNYQQTIIFCGGQGSMSDQQWGNFAFPFANPWDIPASADCQRITPEPADGSAPVYTQDDDMLETRTMGQFIILPNGKLLVVNGGLNGTAGYGVNTSLTPTDQMPFAESFASGPVGTPALYDPTAPAGKRWSRSNYQTSNVARLYHSSALLLPDASVLIAGSNPNLDVNLTAPFPTTYIAERFYPDYFSASIRPSPSGVPKTLSYGGASFDVTIPASSYSGASNAAAASAYVSVVRPGWTTHGMNMGQRYLQLNNTYTVQSDGTIVLHVSQMPPFPTIFQPGPAFAYVLVNGVPSNGTYVIVGSGNIETQPVAAVAALPASVLSSAASGSASSSNTGTGSGSSNANSTANPSDKSFVSQHIGMIAGIAGGVVGVALFILLVSLCLRRRRQSRIRASIAASKAAQAGLAGDRMSSNGPYAAGQRVSTTESQQFLTDHRSEHSWSQNPSQSQVWNQSNANFPAYRDDADMEPVSAHPPTHYYSQSNQSDQSFGQHPGYGQQPPYRPQPPY
ncbi:unnamed protein product [Mycena citricolor]|uniref:Glyoxal oxidase n=1 Tax=Mycena citricolor TaxID=2018698 RepID=A0AAD2HI95_9AGAR|nr:unnamed protein product [Mycena citricolor]